MDEHAPAPVIPLRRLNGRINGGPLRTLDRQARRITRPGSRRVSSGASVLRLPTRPSQPSELASAANGGDRRLAEALTVLGRRLSGDYAIDEFGFDPELTEQLVLPIVRPLYDSYFRVEVGGIEHVPADGGALLIANHAGGLWPLDAAMTAVAIHVEHPAARFLRMVGDDRLFGLPGVGALARKTGATRAGTDDAERLLASGQLVGVWPEGYRGLGKPFRERYRLRRFGRGAFVAAAVRSGTPIVPVSIVGGEEIHPVLGNAKTLARVLGLPYFPITPTFPLLGLLGLVPLPSKWYIEFGAPIRTDELAAARGRSLDELACDRSAVYELTDQVRAVIQDTLDRLLAQRRSVWR